MLTLGAISSPLHAIHRLTRLRCRMQRRVGTLTHQLLIAAADAGFETAEGDARRKQSWHAHAEPSKPRTRARQWRFSAADWLPTFRSRVGQS